MNPWFTMWTQPRNTIRAIVQTNPKYGTLYLAAAWGLNTLFFSANYWSWGLSRPFYSILLLSLVFSFPLGLLWLYFVGWIYRLTGKILRGQAPASHLRAALAWSQIPVLFSILMWVVLLAVRPESVFILNAEGLSSVFIHAIGTLLGIWSLILFIQSLREVQSFSFWRTIANMALAGLLAGLVTFLLFFVLFFFIFFIVRCCYN